MILEDGAIMKEDGTLGFALTGTNYTTVNEGRAVVQGHFIEVTGTEVLAIPAGTYEGMITIKVDKTDQRKATLNVRQDRLPEQNAAIWEYPLYNISVSNGVITTLPTSLIEQGGAVAKTATNVPTYFYRDNGVYLQIGTYSIALTPAQPPASAKRVWIQIDN
jgi:hypothetical protein